MVIPVVPRVSVLIATYNWSEVLPFSVGSVARQTYRDFELLVVGDACTDNSSDVMARLIEEHPETDIRWINCEHNSGNQFGPNNEGLEQARGELIAYLGHDDLWLPHHLEALVAAIDAGADLAHSVVAWVSPDGGARQPSRVDECVAPSSVVHRRALTEQLGGWRPYRELRVASDADLWARAREAGFRFQFVPRLSVVKFSAIERSSVYKTRPCHEQAAWSKRIEGEPDFEAVELARMLVASSTLQFRTSKETLHDFLTSLLVKVPRRLRKQLHILRFGSKGAQIELWRREKGLERKP